MCGIAAVISPEASWQERVGGMVGMLAHRGPDARGVKNVDQCALGHARLSIIDLTTGAQPMSDAAERYWIVFNGEMYNFLALRHELEGLGHRFVTRSDTEVIIAAYHQWGRGCLDRFRGMFAFALWDRREKTLFAARDLFGEKPLYYATTPAGALVIASELKAVVASGAVEPRVSLTSVDAFLAFGYVPPDRTVYENVHVLPPAHCLEWRDGGVRVERYWSPRFETREVALPEAAAELLRLMDQAVERQMIADVPVGAFLSGGLDSSTIVALMQRHNPSPVKTFSVGFGDEINELPYARAVALRYGTEHHEIDLGRPNVAELLLRMVEVYDEPFADTSHIPTFRIAGYARQFVKVVLSGDGGDELFGGYSWYPTLAASESVRLARAQWLVLRAAARLKSSHQLRRRGAVAALATRGDMWERDVMAVTMIRRRRRLRLWGGGHAALFSPNGLFRPGDDVRGLNRAFHFDLTSYLPGDILVKVDRAAMAHGLETRAPFLDRDLVEFALSLPPSLKVRGDATKIVMRAAFEHLWPEELRDRPKQGFGSPLAEWMALPEVQSLIARVARRGSPLREMLPGVREADVQERSYAGWILLTLGLWLERRTGA